MSLGVRYRTPRHCIFFIGYEDFVDIFWGHHKIALQLGVISMHFSVFSDGLDTEWGYFLGC